MVVAPIYSGKTSKHVNNKKHVPQRRNNNIPFRSSGTASKRKLPALTWPHPNQARLTTHLSIPNARQHRKGWKKKFQNVQLYFDHHEKLRLRITNWKTNPTILKKKKESVIQFLTPQMVHHLLTPKERSWSPWPVGWHWYRWKWQDCIADINITPHKTDKTISQAAKKVSVPKEHPLKPTQYNLLDVFQEPVGILFAEEIHNGGCNRADQKERNQAFSGEKSKRFFTIPAFKRIPSHRCRKKKSDYGQKPQNKKTSTY